MLLYCSSQLKSHAITITASAPQENPVMSNLSQAELPCDSDDNPCSGIRLIIRPGQKSLGGFSVRRALPFPGQRKVGPWIFFDHAGPANFSPGEGLDVRPHPHINLATVTYMFEGQFMHRYSLGNALAIKPGDINLMVAGKGIVHSERTPDELRASGSVLHALQLWLALPEADEETDPAFYHYDSSEIPATLVDGVRVRVMMGSAFGVTSPVKTFAETLYFEAHMEAGQSLSLPPAEERAIYVAAGSIDLNGTAVREHSMAVLDSSPTLTITASADSRIALIGGESLGERYIDWNFVSSRKERIQQARQDWKEGRFAKVPGDEEEFIPLPEEK
jgi:redox-sensitive bicupin YhaK (pirin superfamily)